MITSCTVMLVLTLLVLVSMQGCSGEDQDSVDQAALVSTMKEISQILQCFGDTVQEGLDLQKQNNDALMDLQALRTLPDMVLQLKDQINQRNESIDSENQGNATLLTVDTLNKEIEHLKYKLASKEKLEKMYTEIIEDLKNQLKDNATKVGTQNYEQEQMAVCMTPEKVPHHIQEIKEVVQTFSGNRDWEALRRGMLAVLDHNSALYWQVQNAGSVHDVGYKGNTQLAALLLCVGLPVDTASSNGWTMLHGAAAGGHLQLVKLLLDHGASVGVRDIYNSTPLIEAGYWGHLEVVQRLVQAGADTTARKTSGHSAWDLARSEHHTAIVQYLGNFPR